MVASRVAGAAARLGLSLDAVASVEQAAASCAEQQIRLLIVDLSTPRLDVAGLVGKLTALADRRPKIIAFGPHVHEPLLTAAREAGCDEVVSRGQFFAHVDEVLQRTSGERDDPAAG